MAALVLLVLVVALALIARWLWEHRRRIDFPQRPLRVGVYRVVHASLLTDELALRRVIADARLEVVERAAREAVTPDEDPTTWPISVHVAAHASDWMRNSRTVLIECAVPPEPV